MTFESPEWFFLLAALAFAGWFWPRLALWRPLRALALLALVLLLTDPHFTREQDRQDLWILLDRSESTEDLVDKGIPEWKKIIKDHKPSRHDQMFFIDYAAEVLEQGTGEAAVYSGNRKLTRTNLAIQNALALSEKERPSRILVFTDGYATEPLIEAAAKLKARGIPLDFRLVREEAVDDFSIARLHTPVRAQVGEPFVIGITVRGHEDLEVPLRIYRNGHLISPESKVPIVGGVGKVEFTDRIGQSGSYHYTAEILPEEDAHPGNNKSERWIEITGGPRVLLVSKYTDDPIAAVLTSKGFAVEIVSNPLDLQVGKLSGTRAVIFNNIPAFEVPNDFLDAIPFFVEDQGGGFMMVGGEQSFGSGGYFQSSVDRLLPVSMELKTEHRKLAVAMAIVMDRSGSMTAQVAGGKGRTVTKMHLANTGAATAIDLLGFQDKICVFAVDSAAHTVIKLSDIGNNKKAHMDRVRRVQSTGGGIYVYEGLLAAWRELKKAKVGTRHIILFSDAADSEEPGNYKKLVQEIVDNSGSVSVIGLGTRADSDAKLLEDIAKRGNGRIFFTNRPLEIPKLFAQETVSVARSAFIKDPVATKPTGNWSEIATQPLNFLPEIDGYNLSYARKEATTSLVAADDYLGPLVAHARRGIGRTLAVSFPLGGEFSERARSWPGYGDFVQTLARWLRGDDLPPGLGMRHRLEGTRLTIDLLYDPGEWNERFARQPPRIKLLEGEAGGTPYEISWKRVAPGHFSVSREMEEGVVVRGAVQAGSHALPFGPVVVGSSTEWAFDGDRLAELREVSHLTGGRELIDLSKAWLRPPSTHSTHLRLPLLLAALLLILLDALITRMGWRLPILVPARTVPSRSREKRTRTKKRREGNQSAPSPAREKSTPIPAPDPSTTPSPGIPSQPTPTARTGTGTPPPESTTDRSSRFDRAKRRR